MSERKMDKTAGINRQTSESVSSPPSQNPPQNPHQHSHRHHNHHGVSRHSTKKFRTLNNTSHQKIDSYLSKHNTKDFHEGDESGQYRQLSPSRKAPKRNFLIRTASVPKFTVSGIKKGSSHEHNHDDYIVEGHGTPTPSEKVSRWHRDIFLMSPNGTVGPNTPLSMGSSAGGGQVLHPRECICDQCMAEYGTYKLYNQMMQERGMKIRIERCFKK